MATTTNTYFVDNTETKYSGPPNQRQWIYYAVSAVNKAKYSYFPNGEESDKSDDVRFTVNGMGIDQKKLTTSKDIVEPNKIPSEFFLKENYPNPFNSETKISLGLPEQSTVKLVVYDVSGKKVIDLTNGVKDAGFYTIPFNAYNLTSGVYIYIDLIP